MGRGGDFVGGERNGLLELRRLLEGWKGLLSGEVAKAGRGGARSIKDSGNSGSVWLWLVLF
jgi:hypothetical protein